MDKATVLKKDEDAHVSALMGLKNDPGWKIIVAYIQENIAALEEKLNGDDDAELEDLTEIRELRNRRKDFKTLVALPDKLISEYNAGEPVLPNPDPYD